MNDWSSQQAGDQEYDQDFDGKLENSDFEPSEKFNEGLAMIQSDNGIKLLVINQFRIKSKKLLYFTWKFRQKFTNEPYQGILGNLSTPDKVWKTANRTCIQSR